MSVANLNTNLNGLMLDGVCERGAACPGQYDAAVPAVLNPKTQWQDGTRRLVMSPLKYMPGVAVEVPRLRRSPWPVARGPHKRLLRGSQDEAVSVAEGSGHAGRLPSFVAEKRPLKLCLPEAADRH